MDERTKRQRARISWFAEQIAAVQDDVWDAFETSLMSDAKFSVYELCSAAKHNTDLPEILRNELCAILNDARCLLISEGTTDERSSKAHAKLGEAKRYLRTILMQGQA